VLYFSLVLTLFLYVTPSSGGKTPVKIFGRNHFCVTKIGFEAKKLTVSDHQRIQSSGTYKTLSASEFNG